MKFKPLGARIVVELEASKETSEGGIVIPENARETLQEATVIAKSGGVISEINVGDKVLLTKYSGFSVKIEGRNILIVPEEDVLGIISSVEETE